jgi:hypothetical protein
MSFLEPVLPPVLLQHMQAVGIRDVLTAVVISVRTKMPVVMNNILRQLLKPLSMPPTLSKSSIGQGHQCANSQHLRISLRFVPRHIDESAYACIVIVDKVSDPLLQC